MMWSVETLGTQVDAEILALPKDMQAAFVRLAERIEAVGLERIGQPRVKHLQDKLWEMRLTGLDGSTPPAEAAFRLVCDPVKEFS